jgi:hypothetical protein
MVFAPKLKMPRNILNPRVQTFPPKFHRTYAIVSHSLALLTLLALFLFLGSLKFSALLLGTTDLWILRRWWLDNAERPSWRRVKNGRLILCMQRSAGRGPLCYFQAFDVNSISKIDLVGRLVSFLSFIQMLFKTFLAPRQHLVFIR